MPCTTNINKPKQMNKNRLTATGIVFNSKKQILMIYRNKLQVWLPPGGDIEENEMPDDALLRQIYEETGIKAEILPDKHDLILSDNDLVYICKALNEDFSLQKSEAGNIGWFSVKQIDELKIFENVKKAIRKANGYFYKFERPLFRNSEKANVSLSKYLSRHLRHKPHEINLTIDKNGWANIDELIEKSRKYKGREITLEMIINVVKNNDKQRFKISDDGKKIRANQGHSFPVDLELDSITPPDILYHGTAKRFLSSIMEKGLLPMSRLYVHLSETEDTALNVARRHGEPIVLTIDSGKMFKEGIEFYLSENKVWLTERVPSVYISRMSDYMKLDVAKDLIISDIANVLSLKQKSNDPKLEAAYNELIEIKEKISLGDMEFVDSVLKRHESGGGIRTLEDIQKTMSG